MSGDKRKPTRWLIGLAILVPFLACSVTAVLVYRKVPKLPGAIGTMDLNNLTQVVVPGSAEVYFPEAGAYAVYHEYRSVLDGVRYAGDKNPPRLNCQLQSKFTGADITLASTNVKGDIYAIQNQERVGRLIKTISIEKPGAYNFSCRYMHDGTHPKIVLAVGPNIVWEFFNVFAKPVAAAVSGAFVFSAALGVSILMVGLVALTRRRASMRGPTQ